MIPVQRWFHVKQLSSRDVLFIINDPKRAERIKSMGYDVEEMRLVAQKAHRWKMDHTQAERTYNFVWGAILVLLIWMMCN